ncbi:myoD family inhibitor domain-containing protein-like [Pseudonaja textilis]|uniref:myoD family inhibitor domain-containing protein-like n=1 Tax=Pseudonaja textilis TaxID=8673 RepID=UPI000EA8B107|nr:myoD family inhibitor domain-containing protein-like [Pseudonaja textilis]
MEGDIIGSAHLSAMNSLVLDRIDGTHTDPIKDTMDAIQVTPDSELSPSITTSTSCLSSQQGKVPLRLASCGNGCGLPPQASVKQKQPQASKKQRISSTSSICTTSSKKSCKSTASQIQEVAGDDSCTLCALACLFCEFMTVCSLLLECGACRGCLEACCSGEGGEPLSEGCCGEAGGGNCPCGLGCGMLQDCCGSSDCLEICLECCSICFPA